MKHTLAWMMERAKRSRLPLLVHNFYTLTNDVAYIEPKARLLTEARHGRIYFAENSKITEGRGRARRTRLCRRIRIYR
jgi:hypothetical protein